LSAYHDVLYDGSTDDFWTWLIPRMTWCLKLDDWEEYKGRPGERILKELLDRCARNLTRLEQQFPGTIQRVDVIMPKCSYEWYGEGIHRLDYLAPSTSQSLGPSFRRTPFSTREAASVRPMAARIVTWFHGRRLKRNRRSNH